MTSRTGSTEIICPLFIKMINSNLWRIFNLKVVISGSFRKHMEEIIKLKQQLERDGIEVIKPNNIDIIENPENPEFIKFNGEENMSEYELQQQYYRAIEKCDAHIIFNKGGYIGKSALYELFYGAGTNSFSKMNKFLLEHAQVYLLEKPNIQKLNEVFGLQDSTDIRIYYLILALIEKKYVRIGVDTMYEDFKIKKTINKDEEER